MRTAWRCVFVLIAAFSGVSFSYAEANAASPVKSDERVIFFPTAARLSEDSNSWIVPVHGWIFEPEEDDLFRDAALRELQDALDLDPNEKTTAIFEKRARWFLVDNERNKRIVIRIGEETHQLNRSDKDGHFVDAVRVPLATAERLAEKGRLPFSVKLRKGDSRNFTGQAHLVSPEGISVISDIDDTVKITEVIDTEKLLENTFLKPFQAVKGMANVYAKWEEAGAQFHFVSSSPWQLYEPLSAFLKKAGFPEATYHLKRIRLKDSSFLSLFADPEKSKPLVIEPFFRAYPNRRFILIGDSGEKDPEVYGAIAAKYPRHVLQIFIRDVTGEAGDSNRYREAFKEIPRSKWRIFHDPKSLHLPESVGIKANGGP